VPLTSKHLTSLLLTSSLSRFKVLIRVADSYHQLASGTQETYLQKEETQNENKNELDRPSGFSIEGLRAEACN